jgi:hypothetical protein
MEACKYCGATDLLTQVEPAGSTHYARLACRSCGRLQRWLPRPTAPAVPAVARSLEDGPALLRGTPAQIGAAESIRGAMIRKARLAGLTRTLRVLYAVADASWFLANRERALDELRWPSEGQMEVSING